jgi:hypothetical protein
MSDTAAFTYDVAEQIAQLSVNGIQVATLGGSLARPRASSAAAALNAAFGAGDDFEFCTPSWFNDANPYAVVTVKSAKRGDSSTWYAADKRLIVGVTADDTTYPWWSAARWAQNIRDAVTASVTHLYLPSGLGLTTDGPVLSGRRGSNYGCGEPLNRGTANLEIFHCCDLTVAITASVYEVADKTSRWVRVSYPSTGRAAVLRVNDVGPAAWTGRTIDLSCRGSTKALGVYKTDSPINLQFMR